MDHTFFDFSQEDPLFRARLRQEVLAADTGAVYLDDDQLTQVSAAGTISPPTKSAPQKQHDPLHDDVD